ncbi:MAG: hypothetical protein GX776_03160 [Oxalobacter sp.]|nr:hypothetical protein [Oxalobacter sp.]
MSQDISWGRPEYDIWTDDSPAAKVVREKMPYLLTEDERAKRPVTPVVPDTPELPEPDFSYEAQKASDNIVNMIGNVATEQFQQKQEQQRLERRFLTTVPKVSTGTKSSIATSSSAALAPSLSGQAKAPDVTDMMNTQFNMKVPQAQMQNLVETSALTTATQPALKTAQGQPGNLVRRSAESVASGILGDADAYNRSQLHTGMQKTNETLQETGQSILNNLPTITSSVMAGMTEDGGNMANAYEDARQGKCRVSPVENLAKMGGVAYEQYGTASRNSLKQILSVHAATRSNTYGKKMDNPEVLEYWKHGMDTKVRNAKNSLRRFALTADGYMKATFGDRYISYEKDLLVSYKQDKELLDSNRLISPRELWEARNSDEFADKLEKFGYQTVMGGKLVDLVGLFAGNHVALGAEKLYQVYDAIAQLYTNSLLKNGGDLNKATVLGSMVGKSVAEWNDNIRQVANTMSPVTGTMLLIVNDTMSNEAKQMLIDYVGRRTERDTTQMKR